MAFESVQIVSTRNGSSSTTGYREDLLATEVVGLSLSSMVGVTSVLWELLGRPELSAAGGAGPEPVQLGVSPTASFTVDSDAGAVHKDGTYLVRATINPGSPGQVRKTCAVARLTGLTIPGAGPARTLRKPGGFESLEDTSNANCRQGYAMQENRWHDLVRSIATGGGVIETLAGAYAVGGGATDQTMLLNDANGGGVILDASGGGFTGASALRINTAAGGPVVVARATGNIGVGTAAPATALHAVGAAPAIRLERTGNVAIDVKNVADDLAIVNVNASITIGTFVHTGGFRADLGISIGAAPGATPALSMGAGSTAAISAANTGRLRYNEVTQQWETSTNGGAYVAFGAGTGSSFLMDGISTGSAQLSALTPPATGSVDALVRSVRDVFYLDRTSTLTADGITVVTALGGGRWIRRGFADAFWMTQATWKVDPSGGNDEAAGDPAHALKTRSEFARRTWGLRMLSDMQVQIAASLPAGDNLTPNPISWDHDFFTLTYTGTPISLFTGTVSSPYTARNGATAQPTLMVVNSLSGTWSNSGTGGVTLVNHLVEKTDGLGHFTRAVVVNDQGSKTAWLSPPLSEALVQDVVYSVGDTINVYDYPDLGGTYETIRGGSVKYQYLKSQFWQHFSGNVQFEQCSGPGRSYGGHCVLTNHYSGGGAVSPGGTWYSEAGTTTSVAGGKVRLISAYAGVRINRHVTTYGDTATTETNDNAAGLQSENAGTISAVAGVDVEYLGGWAAIKMVSSHGGSIYLGGHLYGTIASGTRALYIQGRGHTISLSNTPSLGGITSVFFADANVTDSLTNLATRELNDINGNRVIGPVGPTWNDNRGAGMLNLGSAGGVGTSAVNWNDVLGAVGGAAISLTQGSIPFAGASGHLTQDNANLFWDAGNIRVGVGTNVPLSTIHAKAAAPALRLERTGGVAFDFANVADVLSIINRNSATTLVTVPSTGGLRSDLGLSIGAAPSASATLAMGAGSAAAVSAGSTGRIRYNEVLQQWETSTNGGAYAPFGSSGGIALEFDGISTGTAQLSAYTPPATGHVETIVKTVRDVFYLDRASTLTADGITVVTALGGGRFIRRGFADPFWLTVANWIVDPAGGGTTDEGSTTVKTRSEIARRINGQALTQNTNIQINANLLSTDTRVPTWSTSNGPFGQFGFIVTYTGVPVSAYTGTITITQTRSGVAGLQTLATASPAWNPTTLLNKIVESNDGSGHFRRSRICKDMGGGVAWLSAPLKENYAEGTFTNGATVNVWTLPTLSGEEELGAGATYIQQYNYISAPRWIAAGQAQCLLTNCEGPCIEYGGNLGVANHYGPLLSAGGQTQIYAGKVQLIAAGGYYRISDTPTCYSGNESHAALQCEGPGLITTTGAGTVMADIECMDSTGLANFLGGFGGGRIILEGYTYGTLTGTDVIIMGARSGLVSLKQQPNFSVTGVNFVQAGVIGSTASLATRSLDDVNDNVVIGPAGRNLNDNHGQQITNGASAGGVGTNFVIWNDVLGALGGGGVLPTFTAGSIPFGVPGGGLSQDNANLFWDNTNKRLAIGTTSPTNAIDVRDAPAAGGLTTISTRTSGVTTTSAAYYLAFNSLTTNGIALGVTGTAFTAGGLMGGTPNLGADTGFFGTQKTTMYIGGHGVISIQTGNPQAERVRILSTGQAQLSSLSAGGVVRAAAATGQLGIGLVQTVDLADGSVTSAKLEPVNAGKVLGYDGGTGPTGSPFDLSVVAPIAIVNGSGQLSFATGFLQGSVIFQGATQIAQNNAVFFWNDTNHRLGIGTNVPIQDLDVLNASDVITTIMVRNTGSGTHGQAQFVASSNPGGGLGIAVGVAGPSYVATSSRPGVIANSPYIVPHFGSSTIYMGASNTLVFATGTPAEATRLQILSTGQINLSSLSASGVVTAAASTGQLAVTTMVNGQIPFGAASGGGISQDAALFWSSGTHRLGVGTASPGADVHVFRSTGNTFTNVAVETGGLTSGYGASFNALNDTGTVGLFGATGSGYVDPGANPNLGASTTFLRTNNGNPLYLGSVQDITFQTGGTAAERMRILSTGQVEVKHSLGVNCDPDTINGAPSIFAAVATTAADKVLYVLGGGPNITNSVSYFEIADTATFVNAGANILDISKVHIAAPAWIASSPSATLNGIAATMIIEGPPNMAGGHWLFAGGAVYALAVKAGNVLINNDLVINGGITIGGNTLLAGTNTTIFGAFQTQGNIGFFSQTPQAKQTVTGSKASGAAWASLLGALVTYGLVIDSTSP